jgi:hypothetical protein
VIGTPANPIARLAAWNIYQGRQVLPVNGTRWISPATWSVIHNEVMKQCDGIDGVSSELLLTVPVSNTDALASLQLVDNVIDDPRQCK